MGPFNGFPFRSSIFPDGSGRHFMTVDSARRIQVVSKKSKSVVMIEENARRRRA